jgi:hypothetical protein
VSLWPAGTLRARVENSECFWPQTDHRRRSSRFLKTSIDGSVLGCSGTKPSITKLLKIRRIKANESDSVHVTFTTRRETCPPAQVNSIHLPQQEDVKYLGLHLDRRLNLAQTHIHKTEATGNDAHQNALATRTEVKTLHKQQNSHIQSNTQTNLTHGIQLRGTASTSSIEILERFQSKALRTIARAPWYVPNTVIGRDLQTPTVKGQIRHYSSQYSARLSGHRNGPVVNLMAQPDNRRLRRHLPNDLPTRL